MSNQSVDLMKRLGHCERSLDGFAAQFGLANWYRNKMMSRDSVYMKYVTAQEALINMDDEKFQALLAMHELEKHSEQ